MTGRDPDPFDRILEAIDGIDRDECESDDGWWETSKGAAFGAERKATIVAALSEIESALRGIREALPFIQYRMEDATDHEWFAKITALADVGRSEARAGIRWHGDHPHPIPREAGE